MPDHIDGWLVSDAYAVPNTAQLLRLARVYHAALTEGTLRHRDRTHLAYQAQRLIGVPLAETEALNLLYTAWPQFAQEARL